MSDDNGDQVGEILGMPVFKDESITTPSKRGIRMGWRCDCGDVHEVGVYRCPRCGVEQGEHRIGAPYDADVRLGETFTDGDEKMVACEPDTSMYKGRTGKWMTGWWQVGTCDNCGTRCISQAKWMVCHECGETVYGT